MMRLESLGDRAIVITMAHEISARVHGDVQRAAEQLRRLDHPAITDIVPAFASVAVHYDPVRVEANHAATPYDALSRWLELGLSAPRSVPDHAPRLVEIPVCYGGEFGPDLEDLAVTHAIEPDDVVHLHSAPEYVVYMLGFLPGFPYLGGLAPELVTPRRAEPRTHVPAGSVGIGGSQTGVYPLESPGGWHLIGRTPVRLFDSGRTPPTLLSMGDRVRFRPVTDAEFRELVDQGDGALDLRPGTLPEPPSR